LTIVASTSKVAQLEGAVMKFAIASSLLIGFALPAHAQRTPNISPDHCAKLGEQIANRIGGTMESRSSPAFEFSLKVESASELRIARRPVRGSLPYSSNRTQRNPTPRSTNFWQMPVML
jgi:hypothetical protein